MMEKGYLLGFIISFVICILIVLVVIFDNKMKNKKIDNIIKKLPKENMDKIKNYKFYNYEENNNFFKGLSIIYQIVNTSDDVIVNLLFFDNYDNKYQTCSINIDYNTYKQKDLKVGQLINTVHNKRREVWLKVNRIL